MTLSDYLARFRKYRAELLKCGKPADYPDTVAATWNLSFQALKSKSQTGVDLLVLCSFLALDDIPRSLIAEGTEHFPETLVFAAAGEIEHDSAMAELRLYSLITGDGDSFSMHQLVQAMLRSEMAEKEQKKWSAASLNLLNGEFQFDENSQKSWGKCALLLLHALACAIYGEELGVAPEIITAILNNVGGYQRHFADFNDAKSGGGRALKIDEKTLGIERPSVAIDVNNLGLVLQALGDPKGAKRCSERSLKIRQKFLGDDHPLIKKRRLN